MEKGGREGGVDYANTLTYVHVRMHTTCTVPVVF